MLMAFKKISFEESLEHSPLSEDELEELKQELESNSYYHPFSTDIDPCGKPLLDRANRGGYIWQPEKS